MRYADKFFKLFQVSFRHAQLGEVDKKGEAKLVGKIVAERAIKAGVKEVVFDRGGYIYTGRVAELAAGAREGGLDF